MRKVPFGKTSITDAAIRKVIFSCREVFPEPENFEELSISNASFADEPVGNIDFATDDAVMMDGRS